MLADAGEESRKELLQLEHRLHPGAGEGVRAVQSVQVQRRIDHGERRGVARSQKEIPVVAYLHGAEPAGPLQELPAEDEIPGRDRYVVVDQNVQWIRRLDRLADRLGELLHVGIRRADVVAFVVDEPRGRETQARAA